MTSEFGFAELVATLERTGIPHSHHKVIPFVGEIVPDISPEGHVIVFGSYSMRRAAAARGWLPGAFDIGALTYRDHMAQWGAEMLNADSMFCRFDEVLARLPDGLDAFFIRPVVDSKFFAGMVINRANFEEWHHQVAALGEDDDANLRGSTEVMVCGEKDILREYRLWIIDGEVVTASLYKRDGRVLYSSEVDEDILRYGRDRASEWAPARAYVMDVALLPGDERRIIETNTINAAGFYAGDVPKLVAAFERMEF
ncbi:ATP-grasp domain-containing protein [uncultured Methylobacterium sp.]|uniref:ATP-grasp domain-containing protein n=1 Tax=uncultured Methylobacterium sp. TaxID=157278 RepID=UPI002624EB58|nr:ATP-grasp domain-containing protein [uncultured Methylobacterium sp.]